MGFAVHRRAPYPTAGVICFAGRGDVKERFTPHPSPFGDTFPSRGRLWRYVAERRTLRRGGFASRDTGSNIGVSGAASRSPTTRGKDHSLFVRLPCRRRCRLLAMTAGGD